MLRADGEAHRGGRDPCAASSSGESCEWVVVAGWITSDFTSATFASSEKISSESMKRCASS